MNDLNDLAVRCARAEMERDAAIARAEKAEENARQSYRAMTAIMGKDKEGMLDNLHIMGIPARDFAELYEVEMAHRRRQADARMRQRPIQLPQSRTSRPLHAFTRLTGGRDI